MKGDLLKGSRCVVTGASRGIGKAIAEAFAKCGADVLITYVSNKAKADETVAEMEKKKRTYRSGGSAVSPIYRL